VSVAQIVAAVAAVGLALLLFRNRRRWPGERKLLALGGAIVLGVYASGVLSGLPSFEKIITDVAKVLGQWTYALVGAMAFLETGAFIGFIAPGEFTVILGGVIAGQGTIQVLPLIGIVWICAIAGDSLSFYFGHRVGRRFMLKHGPKLRITEERFEKVEQYFDRHGGKTIVIGRFIGFVRPLAPFIAGTSRTMPYKRFLPYSVIGTGLWGSTFCLLGYFFWHSFSTVSKIVGRATLALGIVAGLAIAVVYLHRRLRDPEERRKLEARVERHPILRPVWRMAVRPVVKVAWPHLRFLGKRLTPGNLGIEFTVPVAIAALGGYVFILYASLLHSDRVREFAGDHTAFSIASKLENKTLIDIAKVVTDLGSLPVTAALVVIATVLLAMRKRWLELGALVVGFLLVVLAVHLAKAGIDRPRPPHSFVHTFNQSYPSGHAAYATTYVALAVVAARVMEGLVSRAVLIFTGVAIAVLVGATRVYLRAHYLSDVLGGFGLGVSIFATCGAVALVVGHIRQNDSRTTPPS
jgi:undecaprenyl-diphosphatase